MARFYFCSCRIFGLCADFAVCFYLAAEFTFQRDNKPCSPGPVSAGASSLPFRISLCPGVKGTGGGNCHHRVPSVSRRTWPGQPCAPHSGSQPGHSWSTVRQAGGAGVGRHIWDHQEPDVERGMSPPLLWMKQGGDAGVGPPQTGPGQEPAEEQSLGVQRSQGPSC